MILVRNIYFGRLFVFMGLLCTKLIRGEVGIDWSPFEILGQVDEINSTTVIMNLPIHQYWDVNKGSFRTGVLGDRLNETYPKFVTSLNTKISKAGSITTLESLVVDQTLLFMHGLSALQNLVIKDNLLRLAVHPVVKNKSTFGLNISASLEELQVSYDATLVQIQTVANHVQRTELIFQNSQNLLGEANTSAINDHRVIHGDLMKQLESDLRSSLQTAAEKFTGLSAACTSSEANIRALKTVHLETEHDITVVSLRRDIDLAMEAVRYRAAEELKIAQQQQEFEETQLLATKSDLLQAEVEQVINTFFVELVGCLQVIIADPAASLAALQYGGLAVAAMLTLLEVGRLLLAVARKLCGASFLPQVRRVDRAARSAGEQTATGSGEPSQALTWSSDTAGQLERAHIALCTALEHRLPMPNILVYGPSGSGKSTAVKGFVQKLSGCDVLEVCGADLQALGDGVATQFINNLFLGALNRPLVVIVDDADCLVRARGIATTEEVRGTRAIRDNHVRASGCFFALLTGLRENSKYVGLVLATRLRPNEVDEALLDRLDTTISLSLPDKEQRLMCVLKALGGLRGKLLEEHSGEWMPLDRLSQIADASPGSALEQTALAPLPGGLSASVASVLIACLERVERCESVGIPPAAVTPSPSSSPDPETDTPPEADAFPALSPWEGEALPVRSLHASQFLGLLQEHLAGLDSDAMELLACLRITVAASAGWSHRDLRQFFSAINYAIMCSERCQLTTKMWIRELVYAAQ